MLDKYSGILVIGHGTPDGAGMQAYHQVIDEVRQLLPKTLVEGAFLEFARPTIAEGVEQLTAKGATNIAAVPLFLSAVGHTANDVPRAVFDAVKKWPQVNIDLKKHVGASERVAELSALRFRQALEGRPTISADETLLVIASHGSPEFKAIIELTEYAARREKLTPVASLECCFAVAGCPLLDDVLKRVGRLPYKRIVVQPHLLLPGRYYDAICRLVESARQEFSEIDWIVTEPLGVDRLLAQAVAEG